MSATLVVNAPERNTGHRQVPALERERHRVRLLKMLCAVVLGVAFWYAVPYHVPQKQSADLATAAAMQAAQFSGSLSREAAMPVILGVAIFMLWRLPKRGRFHAKSWVAGFGLAYLAWALASLAWSADATISLKRITVFLINLVLMYALARCASIMELALFGFFATGTVALLSVFADIFIRQTFAPFDPGYRFMGVMTPNFQAMNLLVCLLCGLTLVQRRPRWLVWMTPLLGLLSALMFITRSRAGTLICITMLVSIFLRMARQSDDQQMRGMITVAAGVVLIPGGMFVIGRSGKGALTDVYMMGRTDTQNTASLSNRAPLWKELGASVREHPARGFGFEAFWTPARVERISRDQGWMVPHAHNTYLDEALSLGLVGAVLYTCMLIGGCVVAWRAYRRRPDESSLLSALLLTWLALISLTESVPVAPNLQTLLAYTCLMKLCIRRGPEPDDATADQGELLPVGAAPSLPKASFSSAGGRS